MGVPSLELHHYAAIERAIAHFDSEMRRLAANTDQYGSAFQFPEGDAQSLREVLRSIRPEDPGWQPIDQQGKEDCERCCWAMLLGKPYEAVPDFFQIFKETRRDTRRQWLRENFGMDYVAVRVDGGPIDLPTKVYCIAGVPSPTGHPDGHAVFGMIDNGAWRVLHDPSPQREKSGTVPYEYTFLVHSRG